MMSFEQVIDIFADYLALDTELEVCKSRYGYIRVEFHEIEELPGYCSGMVCRTPKELFDLLLSDYESCLEIQRTKGHRNVTEEDKKRNCRTVPIPFGEVGKRKRQIALEIYFWHETGYTDKGQSADSPANGRVFS